MIFRTIQHCCTRISGVSTKQTKQTTNSFLAKKKHTLKKRRELLRFLRWLSFYHEDDMCLSHFPLKGTTSKYLGAWDLKKYHSYPYPKIFPSYLRRFGSAVPPPPLRFLLPGMKLRKSLQVHLTDESPKKIPALVG